MTDALTKELGSRMLTSKSTKRYLYAVILENDNGLDRLYVPEKQERHMPNARSSISTLLKYVDLDVGLARDLKLVDFNALIEFAVLRSKPEVQTYCKKKQRDLQLAIENTDFQADEMEDAWEEYVQRIGLGIVPHGDALLKMLKYSAEPQEMLFHGDRNYTPSTHVESHGWGLESKMEALAISDDPRAEYLSSIGQGVPYP